MRISDWSSDVCSSDLFRNHGTCCPNPPGRRRKTPGLSAVAASVEATFACATGLQFQASWPPRAALLLHQADLRSEEHTSELQSLMRISYAVFCLKKKKIQQPLLNRKSKYTPSHNY